MIEFVTLADIENAARKIPGVVNSTTSNNFRCEETNTCCLNVSTKDADYDFGLRFSDNNTKITLWEKDKKFPRYCAVNGLEEFACLLSFFME